MVEDRTNYYYTQLLDNLANTYSGMDGSQEKNDAPPSFPYMYFKQLNGSTELTTLSGTEDGISLTYEIRFYSSVSPNDVRNIANSARKIMLDMGFSCDYFRPDDNVSDSEIKRFITRFSKLET